MRKSHLFVLLLAFGVCENGPAWAASPQIEHIHLETEHTDQIRLSLKGAKLPSFQIYPLGKNTSYALDLPGTALEHLSPPIIEPHALLKSIVFEKRRSKHLPNPRAVLNFNGEVTYEITSEPNALHFTFSFTGTQRQLNRLTEEAVTKRQIASKEAQKQRAQKQEYKLVQQQLYQMSSKLKLLEEKYSSVMRQYDRDLLQSKQQLKLNHDQILSLDSEITAKNNLITRLKHKAEILSTDQRQKQTKLTLAIESHKKMVLSIQNLKEQYQNIVRQVGEQQQASARLKTLIKELRRQEASLTKAKTEINHLLKNEEEKLSKRRASADNLQRSIETLQKKRREEAALLQHQNEEQQSLKNVVSRRKNELVHLDQLQNETTKLNQIIASQKQREQQLFQRIEDAKNELTTIEEQKRQRDKEANKVVQKHQERIAHLNQQIKRLRQENTSTSNEHRKQIIEETTIHEHTLAEYRKKITAARNTLTALNNEHTALKAVITDDNAKHKLEIQQANQQKENIEREQAKILKDARLSLEQIKNNEKQLQKSVGHLNEELREHSKKIMEDKQLWEAAKTKRLKKETRTIEALRQTQNKLKQQLMSDMKRQEKEFQKETLSHKKRQEAELKKLREEKQALIHEIAVQKKQHEALKQQSETAHQQLSLKHQESQKERDSQIDALKKKNISLTKTVQQLGLDVEKQTVAANNKEEVISALQSRFNELEKNNQNANKRIARLQKAINKNQPKNKPSLAASIKDNTLPLVNNRYWQIAPEKIRRDKFGGDIDLKPKEPGRGILNRLMVVRNKHDTGSSVGLRIDGGARFAISRQSPTSYVIQLFDTRAGNLKVRPSDASDINTNVLRLLPHVEEDQRHRISLRIELRKPTRLQTTQDGTLLWLRFNDPT